ncbi:hypothetical protein GRJ2_002490300 [Grus japonensis]|uniref:Uncharacterized protein n=1 Tax=Grus japonensis TaxID=30415 RepID=A0ABC9XR96_GRUJA
MHTAACRPWLGRSQGSRPGSPWGNSVAGRAEEAEGVRVPPPTHPAPHGWRHAVSPSLEAAPEPQPGVSTQRDAEPQRQRTL